MEALWYVDALKIKREMAREDNNEIRSTHASSMALNMKNTKNLPTIKSNTSVGSFSKNEIPYHNEKWR